MGTRKEQREKRRREILEIALDLFISKGYADTKISDIAGKTGMSAGLMFHYFKSKAGLYEELIRIGVSGPASVMELDASDPLRFFETAAAYILTALRESPFAAKMFVLMEQVYFHDDLPAPIRALLDQNETVMEKSLRVIEEGQARGQIRPGDPAALYVLFWQALSGVALYAALHPGAPIPEPEWLIDCIRRKTP